MSQMIKAESLINLEAYPIHQEGAARESLVQSIKAQLHDDGCAVLKNFLTPDAIKYLTQEADDVAHLAHRSYNRTNPYFTQDDLACQKMIQDDVFLIVQMPLSLPIILHHQVLLRMIHDFPALDPFIKECLEQDRFTDMQTLWLM